MQRCLIRALAAALTLVPTAALAHTGIGDAYGFVQGFAHPLGGLDHVLAMVTVGIFAWQLGGRALWLLPATFVLVMAAAGGLGLYGIAVPFVEFGIAASVIVLGAVVALGVKAPLAVAMGVAGLFAVFHGHAHGTEMPLEPGGAAYAAGFMLATALLHAGGIALGFVIGRIGESFGRYTFRLGGALVALAGVATRLHGVIAGTITQRQFNGVSNLTRNRWRSKLSRSNGPGTLAGYARPATCGVQTKFSIRPPSEGDGERRPHKKCVAYVLIQGKAGEQRHASGPQRPGIRLRPGLSRHAWT